MDVEGCLSSGLLKRERKDLEKARKSVDMAEHKITLARRSFEAGIHEDTVINAYASMFHAARALLFRDGFVEKSHYALFVYLREKYRDILEPHYIHELNSLRLERHEMLYGLEKKDVTRAEADEVLQIAGGFLKKIREIL